MERYAIGEVGHMTDNQKNYPWPAPYSPRCPTLSVQEAEATVVKVAVDVEDVCYIGSSYQWDEKSFKAVMQALHRAIMELRIARKQAAYAEGWRECGQPNESDCTEDPCATHGVDENPWKIVKPECL